MPILSAQKSVLKLAILGLVIIGAGALVWNWMGSDSGDGAANPQNNGDTTTADGGEGAPDIDALDPSPIDIPTNVLALVGSSRTADVLTDAQELVGDAFGDPIDLDAALRTRKTIFQRFTGLSGKFKLRNTSVLDFRRNLAFVYFDPTQYGRDPSAYVIGFESRAKMEKAFYKKGPKRLEKDVEGNWGRYKTSSKAKTPIYVNFVGSHVVFTRHPKIFSDHEQFFTKITQHRFRGDGTLTLMVSHITKAYGGIMGEKVGAARGLLTGMATTESPLQSAAQKALKLIGGLEELSQSLERIEGTLAVDDQGFRGIFHAKAKPKSGLAGFFAGLKGSGTSMLSHVPSNTTALAAFSMSDRRALQLVSELLGVVYALGSGASTPEDFKRIEGIMQDVQRSLTGDMAQLFLPVPTLPETKGRLTNLQLYTLATPKEWTQALNTLYTKMSEMKSQAQGAGPFLDVSINPEVFQLNGRPVSRQKFGSAQFNVQLPSAYFWSNDTHAHVSTGRDAKKVLTFCSEGKSKGFDTNPVVKGIMEQAAENTFGVLFISPLSVLHYYDARSNNALLKRLLPGVRKNPLYGTLSEVPKESGLAVTLGQKEGHLEAVVHLPVQLIKDVGQMVDILKK